MDMVKIGSFLQTLRREQGLTQAQLGEALGVTGKTVSLWETGTYLPPVEMLLLHEQQRFWRRKWRRDHRGLLAMLAVAAVAVQVTGAVMDRVPLMTAGAFLTLGGALLVRNRQEDYVEHHLYDDRL